MAKRKTKHKVKRRRVGGIGRGSMMEAVKGVLGVTIGIVGGRLINSSMATMDGKLLGGGEAILGGLVAVKAKNVLIKGIGAGLAGNGVLYAAGSKGLNLLPASMGYGPPGGEGYRSMNGYRDVPKIGFPKPGNIGNTATSMERNRQSRMYAGIYN
jgi:hypothetical protein